MPEFFHDLPGARDLFATLAAEKGLHPAVVEKDYWVMHALWGLQQNGLRFELKGGTSLSKGWAIIERFSEDIDIRFDSPSGLNVSGEKESHIRARLEFFDGLAGRIRIPGMKAGRNTAFDDPKARNAGIGLTYESGFDALEGLRQEVLLEAGFARTVPNEPRDFSSWVLDRAFAAGLKVADNRAPGVKCFNPEYTFVDKIQAVCRYYRQHREAGVKPRIFLRHYYDLFMLLGVERVVKFMRTDAYDEYKEEKISGADLMTFAARDAFTLPDPAVFALFEKEFEAVGSLLLGRRPSFGDVARRLREHADRI